MSNPTGMSAARSALRLQFPQSRAVYDDYADAQRAVDHLADNGFPVENCMIVGTDLKQVERVTGRLTTGRVALGGALSGLWLGLFVGLVFSLFGTGGTLQIVLSTALFGVLFGLIWALVGYAATRGRRDFTSIQQVVATRYEVLVEHKVAAQARDLLAGQSVTNQAPKGAEALPGFHQKEPLTSDDARGAEGTRTPDPLHAMEVRYQLRHSPAARTCPARATRES